MITHKLVNKKNPKNVLFGTLYADARPRAGGFVFIIDGESDQFPRFFNEDYWELEKIFVFPTANGSIIRRSDVHPRVAVLFVKIGGAWVYANGHTDTNLKNREMTEEDLLKFTDKWEVVFVP